jgi:RNA polymerase sigma factor (sigma-70 family)
MHAGHNRARWTFAESAHCGIRVVARRGNSITKQTAPSLGDAGRQTAGIVSRRLSEKLGRHQRGGEGGLAFCKETYLGASIRQELRIDEQGPSDSGYAMRRLSDSQTSLTLMEMLRQYPWDSEAWERFVTRYRPKIFGWCRAWGLQAADAEDVAQEVIAKLTQKMARFQYDESRCFRAWLKTVAQHTMSDLVESRARALGRSPNQIFDNTEARLDLEKRIEEIFDRELLDLAVTRVRQRVAPLTWDAFRLTAFEAYTGAEASQMLGIPVASVFVAKHRVQKILTEEIGKLEDGQRE